MLTPCETIREKLDRRATTFCHCWRINRRDGAVMGFTDHDRDISFGGVVFRAHSGLSPSEAESSLGLAVASSEVSGALSDDSLSEADLLNGLYDNASVETWLVDWTETTDRILLDVASVGEVRRGEHAFCAELRSSAHYFDQTQGRAFQRGCAADLGDAHCKVDPADFTRSGIATAFAGGVLTLELGEAVEPGFFTGGRLAFLTGANAGSMTTVKSHRQENGWRAALTLWSPPGGDIATGDAVSLTAGCDKSVAACRSKFGNIVNFRGFPHMPGNDRVIAYPSSHSQAMDGGSFFR